MQHLAWICCAWVCLCATRLLLDSCCSVVLQHITSFWRGMSREKRNILMGIFLWYCSHIIVLAWNEPGEEEHPLCNSSCKLSDRPRIAGGRLFLRK